MKSSKKADRLVLHVGDGVYSPAHRRDVQQVRLVYMRGPDTFGYRQKKILAHFFVKAGALHPRMASAFPPDLMLLAELMQKGLAKV